MALDLYFPFIMLLLSHERLFIFLERGILYACYSLNIGALLSKINPKRVNGGDQRYNLMFGSKINQLSESSFRQRPSPIKSSGYKGRVASILIGADEPTSAPDLREQLRDYLLSLPPCPYHHEPIRLLCLSPSCPSSTFSLCSHPHCKNLHSHPDTQLIQLQSFNEFMGNNCTSMLLLSRKAIGYLIEIKQKLMLLMDKAIAKTKYIFDNVYIGEVPRLIRQGRHHQLTSKRLFQFVKHESFENNAQQRIQMEGLRNEVATRIAEMQQNFDKLAEGRELQGLLLADIVKSTQEESPFAMNGRTDIHRLQSTILQRKEEFEQVFRLLKENRAPTFSSLSTLFRASEHHFSAEAFHRTVDGKGPLLILVKSTLGKKFGAFLNLRMQQREEWIPDATGLSFIFSLDRRQAYKLKSQAKCRLKAAFGGPSGPQIGSGCDLYLMDQCHLKRTSGANLGGSYKLPPFIEAGSPKAKTYLAGEQFFLVSEYEVCLFE